jgi:hypothetical protein
MEVEIDILNEGSETIEGVERVTIEGLGRETIKSLQIDVDSRLKVEEETMKALLIDIDS